VREVWFHSSTTAETVEGGWLKFPLAAPVTVDLALLSNGNISSAIWPEISLPVGDYQQIRIFLADTESTPLPSALAQGLTYNNQINVGSSVYPLRVPTPDQGIRLPGTFRVAADIPLQLVLDFDLSHDIVEISRNGETEYILKPRLSYFELHQVGAITGELQLPQTFASYSSTFIIKAETPKPGSDYRQVIRATTIRPDGSFTLYPVPIFGTATTARYDVVIRGDRFETTIVRNVPVRRCTTPATATTLGPAIPLTPGDEYAVDATVKPSGAWVQFYQSIAGDPIRYEIRFRHLNPLTGTFTNLIGLSSGSLHVGDYNGGLSITLATVTPVGDNGAFAAAADGLMYQRSAYVNVIPADNGTTIDFGTLTPSSPAANSIECDLRVPMGLQNKWSDGVLFVTHGGMIVDRQPLGTSTMGMGGTLRLTNLPGGTPASPLPGAFYGLHALGWGSDQTGKHRGYGLGAPVDLRTGNNKATMTMLGF
jgi:hypothetical protein